MVPLTVMLFLITLLPPSMHTDGRVLTQTKNESTISSNHETNHKAILDKTYHQGEENKQAPEKVICASNQDQILFEDLASAEKHKLNLSKNLMTQSNRCTEKHQMDPVNFNHMVNRLQGIRVRYPEYNPEQGLMYDLDKFLDLVRDVLVSR